MKLSIVIPTKNDAQNCRLDTVLGEMKHLPVEILVVDWGSLVPIVTPEFVTKITVPPEIASKYDGDSYFSFATATNVGLRRATGEYITFFGNDTFCDESFVDWVEHVAIPEVFFLISRKNLNSLEEKEKARAGKMTADYHASGAQIAHRDVWHTVRGFDQRLIYYGWMEHELRVRAKLASVPAAMIYKTSVYHFMHPRSRMRQEGRINERIFSPEVLHPVNVTVNDENWGLWNEAIR